MSYTSYLRYGIIGGLCVALLIPFIAPAPLGVQVFGNLFFPYITGKNFAFRIIVELILLAYVILAVREPKYRPKGSLIMWSVLGFVLWMGLATLFSVDPVKSFWSNFERMEGYLGLLHLFALFVVTGAVLTASQWWGYFFRTSVGVSAFMGFYAVLQLFNPALISSQSGTRVDTTFGNATYLAVYMLIQIFLTLFLLVQDRKSITARWLYGTALVLQGTALFFTETRSAALGLVGGLLVAAIYLALRARGKEWILWRRIALGGLASVIILGGLFVAFRHTSFIQNTPMLSRIASISLTDTTTVSRFIYIWPMAVKGGLEKPIFGWGQENFSYIFNQNYDPAMYAQESWFDRAHNQFLDWLVAGGIPGFLFYLALFVFAVWGVVRAKTLTPPEQAVLVGLFAAYAFNNMFVFDNLISAFYFFTILAFIHSLSRTELSRFMVFSKPANDQVVAVVAPVIAIVVLGGAWMFNAQAIARAETLIDAITPTQLDGTAKDPKENLKSFKQALKGNALGRQEVMEQLFQYSSSRIAPDPNVDPDVKQDFYTFTRSQGEQLLAERTHDARIELFMALFLNQFGQVTEAVSYIQKALEDSPNKQQTLFQLGGIYLEHGEADKALPVFKEAFDLAPGYNLARVYYAAGLMYTGQQAQADALLIDGFGTVLYEDNFLLQIYTNLKLFDRVVDIWKSVVSKNPSNVDFRLKLASAFFMAGDNEGAVGELRKIIQLNPAMAPQAQALINQIQSGTLTP